MFKTSITQMFFKNRISIPMMRIPFHKTSWRPFLKERDLARKNFCRVADWDFTFTFRLFCLYLFLPALSSDFYFSGNPQFSSFYSSWWRFSSYLSSYFKTSKKEVWVNFDFASDFFSHSNSSSNSDFSSDSDFSSNPGSSNSNFSSDFEASMPQMPNPQSPACSSDTVLLQPDNSVQAISASLTAFENGKPLTVFLTEEFLLIGKHPELADLCLSIPTVSRLHARIRKDAACFSLWI